MWNKYLCSLHYWTYYYLLRIIFKVFFRWEIEGLENFPAKGGFILAVNHTSYFDPPLVGSACPRKIFYLARKSLFKNRFWDGFLRSINAVPIDREGYDVGAIKTVIDIVHSGEGVLIFPEGTRSPDGKLQLVRHGIGFVAMRSQADILPCYVSGAWHILPKGKKMISFHKVKIIFGPMIRYSQFEKLELKKANYQMVSNTVMEKIAELRDKIEK